MKILAIDTSAEYGSIALVVDGELAEEVPMHSPDGFGHILFANIGSLLARHGLQVSDVDCFASATGPGSFTGVRVGLTAAKALAESVGKRVAGVSNLRAIAFYGQTHKRAVVLDARRGDVYVALYDATLRVIDAELVKPVAAWLGALPDDAEFVSQNFAPYEAAIAGTRFALSTVTIASRSLAGTIGVLAARDALMLDPAVLDANYVRRSDAELSWKEA